MRPLRLLAEHFRHAYLLASLVLVVLVEPFLTGMGPLRVLLSDLLLLTMVVAGIAACARSRAQLVITIGLGLLSQASRVWGHVTDSHDAARVLSLAANLLFTFSLVLIMIRRVFGARRVSADTIYGAVTIYVLFGLLWAFAYAVLLRFDPQAFELGGRVVVAGREFEAMIGFSYVTLTTLGYGNIYPLSPQAEAAVSLQAIVGQLYLAVLVARLVGMHISQGFAEDRRSGRDEAGGE